MLVFGTNVVIDDHLHVESIESFGSEGFFLCLIRGGFNLLEDLDLDVLDVDFGFVYHFQGLAMFFHLGKDGGFVQIGWDNAVLFFRGISFQQFFLEIKGVIYGPKGYAKGFLFFVDAG